MPDSVMRLTGRVVMYHNGAVLTCDSVYRFGSKHIECYGRVLINKDETYIYGDRAVYDGYANNAQVFAPLIKVVDGDATLYTYNFSFNTLDNIGRYWGRGTMTQKDNTLESDRGYYYADTREFIAVDNVQATNPEYKLVSDSVRYNMNSETAEFDTSTTIWNEKGEIVYATRGTYHNPDARYEFTRDTYMLTKDQEVWCDSLDYDSRVENAILKRDIQICDEAQQVMAFGDFGQYWGAREEALLTQNPSMLSYDPEQDTLYMRSDTMRLYSIPYESDFREYDSLRRTQHLLTIASEQAIIGGEGHDTTAVSSLPPSAPPSEDERHKGGYEDAWTGTEDSVTRENLRRIVMEKKREMFMQGDTLTREMLTPGMMDTLLRFSGYSSEDIEGQLLFNKSKRELEERGSSVNIDSLVYKVLEATGAFGDPQPPTEVETAIDSLQINLPEKIEDITKEVVIENNKRLSRRERRRLERESKTKNDKSEIVDSLSSPTSRQDSIGNSSSDSLSKSSDSVGKLPEALGKLPENLGGILQDSGLDLSALLKGAGNLDLTNASDSLRNKLREMGVDTDALLGHAKNMGLDLSLPANILQGDTLTEGAHPLSDSLASPVQDSLAGEDAKTDSLQRVIFAYGDVRIYRTDLQAVCDSMVGFSKDSTAHLYKDPVMWNKQNQITADVIDIFTKNEKLHRAFFTGSPMMVSEVDSTQFNQIKGREMEAFFHDNEIYWHNVTGNAQTLYYLMDEAAGAPNGFLVVNSASIAFHFKEQTVDRLAWYKEVSLATYPLDKIPLEQGRFLDGFRWRIDSRPELKDVFGRTIRPTQREKFEALPQPLFPISEGITRDKKKFTEMRIWEDRNDTLSPIALEFLRYLGVRE